nr:fibropellin-1-like [Lytechinus pictus]
MDVGSDATNSTISGLETNTLYVINVLSAVDDGDGYTQFSEILADRTLYGRTGGAQPGDIFLRKLTSYSFECEFEPLQSNVNHYLNFTVGDSSNPSVRSVNDPHSTWAIYELTPGETYRLVLGTDRMTGQEKWVTTIPLPPENVRVVSYTSTTLTIAWNAPAHEIDDPPPIVDSYQVEVSSTDIIVKVNSTVTEVTIEDLHSGSSYGISVKSLAGVNEVKSIGSVILPETDTDECISNPCGENGECFNVPDLYFCLCYEGWTGINCNIDIDDCVPNPCANGGTCTDGVNTFFCECVTGYTGDLCNGDVDECHSDPCAGNSECRDGINFYYCICLDGWTGNGCDENIDDCLPDSCDNGGTCKDGVNTVICICPRGYTGQRCQTDIDDCLPEPCLNGGSCEDGLDLFTCKCPEGVTGFICEININDCIPDPCMNGGSCKDGVNAYTCECPPGIIGLHCEEEINECESYPCLNGADCTDGNNAFSCRCLVGFTGQRCQTDINECASDPCLNGGTCNDEIDAYTCNCSAGFLGQRCAEDFNECTSNPCTNGACLDGTNMYYCTCQPGWTGVNCDINFDECSSHPCLNEASCIDKINGFTCTCAYGFTGDRCQEDIDECISDPCANGQCFDGRNLYNCICIPGWTGVNCEIDINECSSNPCDNGGTCMDEIDRFTCYCPDGVIGQLCENEDPCNPSPCMNNCSCSVADNNMIAVCTTDSQYIAGEFCEIVNECFLNDICENGGTCVPLIDSSKCICPIYFTGDRCEIPWCPAEVVCHGNGNCAVIDGEPACFCFPSWVGSFCDIDNPCLPVNPCYNSGECTYDVNEFFSSASISCICDPSWTGDRCEIGKLQLNNCRSFAFYFYLLICFLCVTVWGFRFVTHNGFTNSVNNAHQMTMNSWEVFVENW